MAVTELNKRLIPGRSYLYSSVVETTELLSSFDAVDSLIFDGVESDAKSARQFVVQAQLGAFGKKRLLLVKNADAMSEIVQNTLLKLLEEPPSSVVIVLQTQQAQKLLPTVLSRLHSLNHDLRSLTDLTGLDLRRVFTTYSLKCVSRVNNSLPAPNIKQSRLQKMVPELFDELTEMSREDLTGLLADEMSHQQQQLFITPSVQVADRVALLDLAVKKLSANANLKLTVDWLLLRWANN